MEQSSADKLAISSIIYINKCSIKLIYGTWLNDYKKRIYVYGPYMT